MYFTLCVSFIFQVFLLIYSYEEPFRSYIYVIIYCVGAEITTLMSNSDGLDPYFFCRKIEKTRSMQEEMDGELFISRQNRHFSLIDYMIKVLFPICTLIWRVSTYVSRQGNGINRRNESTVINIKNVAFAITLASDVINCLFSLKLFPRNKRRYLPLS